MADSQVIGMILPLVLGPLTSVGMDLIKKASKWVALQSPRIKQLIVVGLSLVTVEAAHVVTLLTTAGVQTTWWGVLLTTLLTAGLAFATKNLRDSATKV